MTVRDEAEDFRLAYIAEYEAYEGAGEHERAKAVAGVLRGLGVDVEPLERVDMKAPETAVDPKPARPRKPKSDEDSGAEGDA